MENEILRIANEIELVAWKVKNDGNTSMAKTLKVWEKELRKLKCHRCSQGVPCICKKCYENMLHEINKA